MKTFVDKHVVIPSTTELTRHTITPIAQSQRHRERESEPAIAIRYKQNIHLSLLLLFLLLSFLFMSRFQINFKWFV